METGPVFRALMHNRTRFWLITLEVALTLAIAINCVAMIRDIRRRVAAPTGLDEEHLLVVVAEPFGPQFEDGPMVNTVRREDLRRLRALPGVRDACTIDHIPLGGSGSSTGFFALGTKQSPVSVPWFTVSDRSLQTLGMELTGGRDFEPGDFEIADGRRDGVVGRPARNVIVTQTLAELLVPEGEPLGKTVENPSGRPATIVGIVRLMRNAWPRTSIGDRVMLLPGTPRDKTVMRYMVRAEQGAVASVFNALDPLVREVNPSRVVTVESLTDIKQRTFRGSTVVMQLLGAIIAMLVGVTLLGIVGLTSFSVTERTRQIGTRRALGATKVDIVRYFLLENWMITGIGLTLGVLLTVALNYLLAGVADAPKLSWQLVGIGIALMWIAGLLAALVPAIRATTVPPDLATRTV